MADDMMDEEPVAGPSHSSHNLVADTSEHLMTKVCS